MTRAEKTDMVEELVNYVGEYGVTRDQFVREAATNLALHHPAFQKMAADAIRYQRLMRAPKAVSTKALPPVQRPGVAGPRRTGREGDLQSLQRDFAGASGDRQVKIAARIIEARRRELDQMADEKDFLERTADYWNNRGLDWSPESTVENFGLHGPRKRAEALDQLDTELANFEPTRENMRIGSGIARVASKPP